LVATFFYDFPENQLPKFHFKKKKRNLTFKDAHINVNDTQFVQYYTSK